MPGPDRGPSLTRVVVLSALSGAVWAAIAWALWPRHSPSIGWAMAASPFIGIVIGLGFSWLHDLSSAGRMAVSLVSLYLSATLFGLVVGLEDLARTGNGNIETVLQAVPAVWWGLTFTGYFLILWPLAHFNHWLMARYAFDRDWRR